MFDQSDSWWQTTSLNELTTSFFHMIICWCVDVRPFIIYVPYDESDERLMTLSSLVYIFLLLQCISAYPGFRRKFDSFKWMVTVMLSRARFRRFVFTLGLISWPKLRFFPIPFSNFIAVLESKTVEITYFLSMSLLFCWTPLLFVRCERAFFPNF